MIFVLSRAFGGFFLGVSFRGNDEEWGVTACPEAFRGEIFWLIEEDSSPFLVPRHFLRNDSSACHFDQREKSFCYYSCFYWKDSSSFVPHSVGMTAVSFWTHVRNLALSPFSSLFLYKTTRKDSCGSENSTTSNFQLPTHFSLFPFSLFLASLHQLF